MPSPFQVTDLSAAELSLRLEQQASVANFGRFALETDDLQAILDEASRLAAKGLGVHFAKVLECLPEEAGFLVRAGVGWKPGVVGNVRLGGDLQSPAGYAFRTGKPVITNDLSSESRFRTPRLLLEHGIHSAINVLIKNGEAFGVLEVDSGNRGEFSEADLAFIQALANTLAVAIRAQKREDARAQILREKESLLRENEQLLRGKDILVAEIHHRVANSLQLVHSALSIQLATLSNVEARQQIAEAAARVLAIGAVNRRLYQGGSPVETDANEYMRGLMDDMKALLPSSGSRTVGVRMESFPLSADQLTTLGLISVELVTNTFKHGRGSVRVEVKRFVDHLEVSVSDEGGGFPPDFDPETSLGLGFRIISSLANSAHGPAIRVDRSVPFSRIVVNVELPPSEAGRR